MDTQISYESRLEQHDAHVLKKENGYEMKLKSELKKLIEILFDEEPILSTVEIRTFVPGDRFDAGGYYDFDVLDEGTEQEMIVPVIYISEGDPELLRELFSIRKESIKINAELLGLQFQQMTPQILQFFILAHEFGHIKDFISNYQNDSDLKGTEAIDEMYFHRDSILDTLPIPNLSPTHLARELSRFHNLNEVIATFPKIRKHPKFEEIKSIADILRIQEWEYRNSEPERYADQFAADLLTKFSKKLGISSILLSH